MYVYCTACISAWISCIPLYTEIPSGSAACKMTVRRRDQLPNHQRLRGCQEEAGIHLGDDGRLVYDPEQEYMKWYEETRTLRSDLDSMGLSKTWLRSKKRTPLESKALQSILNNEESKRKEKEKLRQMVRTFGMRIWLKCWGVQYLCTQLSSLRHYAYFICMYVRI